jgi:hypothetical protein
MGNSTIKLGTVFNVIAARGIPDPRGGPSGYGDQLALECANEVMADIVCERYNQKWNRAYANPFYTNSFQQDYPQLAQPGGIIGWGEDGDVVDINNTYIPKPMSNIKWRRGLSRTNVSRWWPENLCWMYNNELEIAVWPGPGIVIYPLLGTSAPGGQNPILNMRDANGNILIVTGFGTTATNLTLNITSVERFQTGSICSLVLGYSGPKEPVPNGTLVTLAGLTTDPSLNGMTFPVSNGSGTGVIVLTTGTTGSCPTQSHATETGTMLVAAGLPPVLPADSAEGTTYTDGTVTWTCVSPTSQGFRIDRLPSAAGPTLEVKPYYQIDPPRFTTMQQFLDPIPDSFSRFFFRGLQAQCLLNSPNPNDTKRGEVLTERDQNGEPRWMKEPKKQGDRELNIYALLPASSVVEPRWGPSQPRTADNPYGWN